MNFRKLIPRWNAKTRLMLTLELAVLWEIWERVTGLGSTEAPTNSLMDIVLSLAGFLLVCEFVKTKKARVVILAVSVVIWAGVNILGQLAYAHYAGTGFLSRAMSSASSSTGGRTSPWP